MAKTHRIVIVSLYPIVKESFQIYYEITEILSVLLERFPDMDMPDLVKVFDIFSRVGKQYDELDLFYGWCKSIGVARSSEYPEIERITPRKLEIMDEYIKEKSLAQVNNEEQVVEEVKEEEPEEDMNAVKALPPPEEPKEEEKQEEVIEEAVVVVEEVVQGEADLLNLGEDRVTQEEQGDKFALALFDGAAPETTANNNKALPWRAFDDEADWETALVQTASNLPNQKPALGGGFDTLLLDGMYKQAETNAAMQGPGFGVSGSASSVALGSAGRPAMLALPAPPGSSSGSGVADPFAASLAVAPPPYVQMSEMEKKQRLLVEEQVMWQQYARGGMQGQVAISRVQHNGFMGGYAQPSQGTNTR